MSSTYDVAVLGAGAAGLMCAAQAGARGRSVLLLDHADRPGKKILISGGGRCNFTNIHTAPDRFLSANPHFAKSALSRYTAHDFLALVEGHGIAWHEKTLGQLFCDGSARQIVDMLLDALFRELSGVATDVVARCGEAAFREAALFTHRGLSGPAILQVSSYWRRGDAVAIDFLPETDRHWLLRAKQDTPRATLRGLLRSALPARLADALAERLGLEGPIANAPDAALRDAEARLSDWHFLPNGSEGFAKAEVTVGGVSTAELSSKTMEAMRVPGLYVIGEAVDVTGWLGGYNFQWAWASAWAAGQAL